MSILGAKEITRRRYAAGSYDSDGRWSEGSATDATIEANVQPASWSQVQQLEEGLRKSDPRLVLSESELRVANQHTGLSGDRLVLDGAEFEVVKVEVFETPGPLPHYEATAVRVREAG